MLLAARNDGASPFLSVALSQEMPNTLTPANANQTSPEH
jgi:hypothetical protein